jgi:sulfotransferase
MDHGIHFISGLPRSGSTLLAAILRQNPKFHAHMTSPVLTMLNAAYSAMGAQTEMSVFIDDDQREAVMKSMFLAYYQKIHAQKTVFDTNRGWTARMPMLSKMFPNAKVICCVREAAWVVDSFERQVVKSPFTMSKMFTLDSGACVYSRAAALSGLGGTVGFAWHAFREACFGHHADRLIVIDYEALTKDPAATMKFIYTCLGEPYFEHDFDNVEYNDAEEFDSRLGSPGLHSVRRKVEFKERRTILPPDLFQRHAGDDFWKQPQFLSLGLKMMLWRR